MDENSIENSLIKYLTGQASENDVEALSQWIKEDGNQKVFDEYVKLHFEISTVLQKEELTPLKNKLRAKINESDKNKVKKISFKNFLKYAALIIMLITTGYFSATRFILPLINTNQHIQEKFVILETEDGNTQQILPAKRKVIKDAQGNRIGDQDGDKLVYYNDAHSGEPSYVTLHVPYGKTFNILLANSTSIHLNSGSSLRYPTFFKKDTPRSVSLNGEAFFEVAKNETQPFIVQSDAAKIKVLGTKFNVTNYAENKTIRTVLVEGSVSLLDSKDVTNVILKPNQRADWNKTDSIINIQEVDTYRYTAWMLGKLIFKKTCFNEISHALERKYNVQIRIENEALKKEIFDASFDTETIKEVLESFKRSYSFEYSIVKDRIVIY